MRAALIKSGVVENIIIAGKGYAPPKGLSLVESDTAQIGDEYRDGLFSSRSFKPVVGAAAVKSECARRIIAVANETAQRNMAAAAAAGWPGESDKEAAQAAFVAGVEWIAAMRAVCSGMISAHDATFMNDEHWPNAPAEAADLASRY